MKARLIVAAAVLWLVALSAWAQGQSPGGSFYQTGGGCVFGSSAGQCLQGGTPIQLNANPTILDSLIGNPSSGALASLNLQNPGTTADTTHQLVTLNVGLIQAAGNTNNQVTTYSGALASLTGGSLWPLNTEIKIPSGATLGTRKFQVEFDFENDAGDANLAGGPTVAGIDIAIAGGFKNLAGIYETSVDSASFDYGVWLAVINSHPSVRLYGFKDDNGDTAGFNCGGAKGACVDGVGGAYSWGVLRAANNAVAVASVNAAGNGNDAILSMNASNVVLIGAGADVTGVNASHLPTSAGTGGLFVCVDSTGNFYKKATCP